MLVNVSEFEGGPACTELPEDQLLDGEDVLPLRVKCEIGVYASLGPLILTENGKFLFLRSLPQFSCGLHDG